MLLTGHELVDEVHHGSRAREEGEDGDVVVRRRILKEIMPLLKLKLNCLEILEAVKREDVIGDTPEPRIGVKVLIKCSPRA